jgi:hypothetical protein
VNAPATNQTFRDRLLVVALGAVCVLVIGLMGGLWRYKTTPGAAAVAPSAWPTGAGLPLDSERLTLVMFAHPMCACTRASLAELRELMGQGGVRAMVLFAQPDGLVEDWSRSDSWEVAAAIPGVAAIPDPGEHEARMFGAMTSGQVVVYDPSGRLVFSGGITAARGHIGMNAGRDQIAKLAAGAHLAAMPTPVFGCPLDDSPVTP